MHDLCKTHRYDLWWIGANYMEQEGEYRWLNGQPVAADVFSWFSGK